MYKELADGRQEPTENCQELKRHTKEQTDNTSYLTCLFRFLRQNWLNFVATNVTFGRAAKRGFYQNLREQTSVYSTPLRTNILAVGSLVRFQLMEQSAPTERR